MSILAFILYVVLLFIAFSKMFDYCVARYKSIQLQRSVNEFRAEVELPLKPIRLFK